MGQSHTSTLSSFVIDEELKKPGQYRKEIMYKMYKFAHILKNTHPPEALEHFLDAHLLTFLENE